MGEEIILNGPEQHKMNKLGANVDVRNFWIRHAQKMSGEVASSDKTTISLSLISEKGVIMSKNYGETITPKKHGAKSYVSKSDRTKQTAENILIGYQKNNPGVPIRPIKINEKLLFDMPKDFLRLYLQKFEEQRKIVLSEMFPDGTEFSKLSPDDQEKVAEAAEEPIIREWLDNDNCELQKLYPTIEAAKQFAKLFNKRHEFFAKKLYSGSEVDLFHLTHKSMTEPFLVSGVLIKKSNGERITKLNQIGGSLSTLGDWQSEVTTDSIGKPQVVVRLRGEEYDVDSAVLENLLK